jgi:CBS domain-containing protein
MRSDVPCVREDDSAADVTDLFQHAHVHGAPVVDERGRLLGMVSQEDLLIGGMTAGGGRPAQEGAPEAPEAEALRVRDIMTAPAISATEDTPLEDLCRMMWRFRIHHIPIVTAGKLVGMVSSLDICRFVGEDGATPES